MQIPLKYYSIFQMKLAQHNDYDIVFESTLSKILKKQNKFYLERLQRNY